METKVAPGNYSMAAVIGLDSTKIEEICKEISEKGMFIVPANYNYSGQTVISGEENAINLAMDILKENGAKRVLKLQTGGPFHTAKLNEAKEILAFELTKLVHGEEEAQKAQDAARALFSNGGDTANMPACAVTEEDLRDGTVDILALLVKSGLAGTRSEARRNVTQGGVTLDGEKVTDFKAVYTLDDFKGEGKVLKRGKKKFIKIVAE